ncbi:hypothetical protein P278_17550 [Zhouia amylolytica AD3]|uniref:DUF6249 domain-containing protein n=2 Tax=Zhouia amylolytica TaxID=376730 RepID=W2UPV8_9FLAO|nr:hypothetical protein P278_17550 [Zhouia amylolytica AD3]
MTLKIWKWLHFILKKIFKIFCNQTETNKVLPTNEFILDQKQLTKIKFTMEVVIFFGLLFATVFGMYYLFITARNKERMSLIEKGADASIFYSAKKRITPMWKIIVINIGCLFTGIGTGIISAHSLTHVLSPYNEAVLVLGCTFIFGGLGLLAGFKIAQKLE